MLNFIQVSKFQELNRARAQELEGAIRIHDCNLNHNGGSNLTSTLLKSDIDAADPRHKRSTEPQYSADEVSLSSMYMDSPFLLPILAYWLSLKYASRPWC